MRLNLTQTFYIILCSSLLAACGSDKKEEKSTEKEETTPVNTIEQPANTLSFADTSRSGLEALEKVYHSKKIGWTIEIPDGWHVVPIEQLEAYDQQAEALLAPTDNPVLANKMEYLVAFQKDDNNMFSSTIERYVEKYPGEYEATFEDVKRNIHTAFRVQNVNVDTSSGKRTFGGKEFLYYNTAIYDKNYMYIMNQLMFSRMHRGYDFAINITYDKQEYLDTLLAIFERSEFE